MRRQIFAELRFEPAPAPDPLHEDRFEGEGSPSRTSGYHRGHRSEIRFQKNVEIVNCGFANAKESDRFT
jgi:hypothetical protein